MYVCMYVCMYVFMYVIMYVSMYVSMYANAKNNPGIYPYLHVEKSHMVVPWIGGPNEHPNILKSWGERLPKMRLLIFSGPQTINIYIYVYVSPHNPQQATAFPRP